MQASNVRISEIVSTAKEDEKEESEQMNVKVWFEHAEALKEIFTDTSEFSHLYTVEITPPIELGPPVMSIPIGPDGQPKSGRSVFANISDGARKRMEDAKPLSGDDN